MDAKDSDAVADLQVKAVEQRIDFERERVGETIEALSYKTDVQARGSEAIASGIETAKTVASEAAEQATLTAIDVAGRASETLSASADVAQRAVSDAIDVARESASGVTSQTWRTLVIVSAAVVGAIVVVSLARRRTPSTSTNEEVLDTITSIDEGAPDLSAD